MQALVSAHMARVPAPQGLLALADWIRELAKEAYEAGRADARVDAAQELDQITGALAEAPWRRRAEINAEFDQACREFDAMQVRPVFASEKAELEHARLRKLGLLK